MFYNKTLLLFLIGLLSTPSSGQYLTYVSDIKPIIDRHCVSCHSPGEVGAMPLTNYEEVSAYGAMIKYVTTARIMPPWYADPSYSHFSNERVMTEEEIKKISHWVDNDMNEGALPYGLVISKTASVTIRPRNPDMIISMSEAFEQYGIYMDQYQVFVLPVNLEEDKWIEGIEFIPGNAKIVRHAAISVVDSNTFDALDQWDSRYGYYSFGGLGKTPNQPYWYTWSPLQQATYYSKGSLKYLPKGSDLILHMHYGPTGLVQKDSSFIRLWFSDTKPEQEISTAPLINPYSLTADSLYIPPATKKIFHASYTVPYPIEVMSLTPQANLICRSWEVYAKIPGQAEPVKLLKIPEWNFNWKQTYKLFTPLMLPEGSVIHTLAHYDNTLDNPCNPSDKPIAIPWGSHLFNEMFFVHFEYKTVVPSNPGVQMRVPVVVSGNTLKANLALAKTDFVEIRIDLVPEGQSYILEKRKFKKGTHSISLNVTDIPNGNYLLKALNKKGNILFQQMVFKLPEKGM